MIGPTFVISSYSRIRRRQAPRSMSSARNPKFLADSPFESLGGGPGLVDVREACLREVRLPPSLTAEFRRDRLEDLGGVHGDVGAAGDDEAHVVRRLGPQDRGRPGLRSASNAAFPAAYSRRTTPSWMRVDRSSLISATSLVRATCVPPHASTSHFGISTTRSSPPGTEPP